MQKTTWKMKGAMAKVLFLLSRVHLSPVTAHKYMTKLAFRKEIP